MRDEHAGIPGRFASYSDSAGPGHDAVIAAKAVIDDLSAIPDRIFVGHDDLGVEGAAGVDAVSGITDLVAEDLGFGSHAGNGFHQAGDIGFRVGVACHCADGVRAVAAAGRAGQRRIPGTEIGASADHFLGGDAGVAHRIAIGIGVTGGVEEGVGGIDAGVDAGDNNAFARHILTSQLLPHGGGADEG